MDDVRSYRHSLAKELEWSCSLSCLTVADFNHAILALEEHPSLRVVVSDQDLGPGEPTGFELLIEVGSRWPDKGRLLISGLTTGDILAASHRLGFDAIDKDLPEEIIAKICELAKRCGTCKQQPCICDPAPRE